MSSSSLCSPTAVYPHRRSCFCLVVHVCATAHLPIVYEAGASCSPAPSDLRVSTENAQFSGCGTESPKGTYRVRWYAARELRFLGLSFTGEAVRSQSDYGRFTVCAHSRSPKRSYCQASTPPHPPYMLWADRKRVLSDRGRIY